LLIKKLKISWALCGLVSRWRQEFQVSIMIQGHPDKNLVRPPISKISRAWWCIPVVSVTLEWREKDCHPGNGTRTNLKNKLKPKGWRPDSNGRMLA
jgi:hypothetical protein